jgi:SagB-type dehydrogenase family enzyme
VNWAPLVFGDGVELDDAAETFHEASRLSHAWVDHRLRGPYLLERSPELQASALRASARHVGATTLALPDAAPLELSLGAALARRRSARSYGAGALTLAQLAAVLRAGYGVTATGPAGLPLRSVPSGGALFPLDLYLGTLRVDGTPPCIWHYDPLRDVLEDVRALEAEQLRPLTPYPDVLVGAAAVVFVAATFWRSRFKYGQRGYRFALLEAGHVAQNVLLAATALSLASVPLGGFFDRQVNDLLELDGLHEAALYVLPLAHPAEDG